MFESAAACEAEERTLSTSDIWPTAKIQVETHSSDESWGGAQLGHAANCSIKISFEKVIAIRKKFEIRRSL